MAFTPDRRVVGIAKLTINTALGTRTVTATHAAGTTKAACYIDGTSFAVNIVESTTGATPPTGNWKLALVRDDTDCANDYGTTAAAQSAAICCVNLGTGGALAASRVFGDGSNETFANTNQAVGLGGTYRIVLAAGNADLEAGSIGQVDTGGASSEWHADSDGGFARGALAPVTSASDRDIGGCGHRLVLTDRDETGETGAGGTKFRNKDTGVFSIKLRPANATSAALINPKQVKYALATDAAGATRPDGVYRITPDTTGDASQAGVPIDTDFGQVVGGTDHYIHVGVDNVLGDSTTPAAEKAGIWSTGTIVGLDPNTEGAWCMFTNAVEDASGNGNHGGITGAPTFAGGVMETDGVDSNENSQGLLTKPISGVGTTSFDIRWSGRRDRQNADEYVAAWFQLQSGTPTSFGPGLFFAADGRAGIAVFDGTSTLKLIMSTGNVPNGARTLRATWSAGTLELFVDAVSQGTLSVTPVFSTQQQFTVARATWQSADANSPYPFDGGTDSAELIRNGTQVALLNMDGSGAGHVASTTVQSAGEHLRSTNTEVTASAALQLKADAGLTTNGVLTFTDSGRTQANRLFNRRQSATLAGPHGQCWFRAWLADAYGGALPSAAVTLRTLDSDATQEDTQDLTSAASTGLLEWTHVIGESFKDFCAFDRTSPDDPDALGTHHIAIPNADIYKPTGTKTGTYPDPKVPTTTRSFQPATCPGRAKDVRVLGRGFSSGKEPQTDYADEFAVAGEIIFAGMYSGNTDQTANNADGVPTGIVTRSKVTAAGSYICKTADVINEAAFAVGDATRANPTDRVGRPFAYTGGFEFVGRRALYNRSGASPGPSDTGTNLAAQQNLETPLGYSIHGTPSQTFDTVAAPSDASTFGYYQGFSNISATRDSFGLAAGSPETPGFTVETGLRGYKLQVLDYRIIRDDVLATLTNDVTAVVPGQTVRFKMKAWFKLPDDTRVPATFEQPPTLFIDVANAAGMAMTNVATIVMTPIGALPTGDYEATYTPPNPTSTTDKRAFIITANAKVAGAAVSSNAVMFRIGQPDSDYYVQIGDTGLNPAEAGNHIQRGKDFFLGLALLDDKDGSATRGQFLAVDGLGSFIIIGFSKTLAKAVYLNDPAAWGTPANIWKEMNDINQAYRHPTIIPNPSFPNTQGLVFSAAQTETIWTAPDIGLTDFVYHGRLVRGNVTYVGRQEVRPSGKKNQHRKHLADFISFATGGILGYK